MQTQTIDAESREVGKKAVRAVRRNNNVPCILYGPETDSVPFQLPVNTLQKLIFSRTTQIVEISVDGESWNCILKDYDLHPITDRPTHADFQVLREGREISLTVPVRFEGIPQGQKEGGDTQINIREIGITCLPKNIPSEITVNISELLVGDALHVSDLDVEGVEFKASPSQTLVTVVAPRLEVLETEEEEAEELEEGELPEGEEAEEGEEGEAAEGEEEEEA